jgi:hypothetical protein
VDVDEDVPKQPWNWRIDLSVMGESILCEAMASPAWAGIHFLKLKVIFLFLA